MLVFFSIHFHPVSSYSATNFSNKQNNKTRNLVSVNPHLPINYVVAQQLSRRYSDIGV